MHQKYKMSFSMKWYDIQWRVSQVLTQHLLITRKLDSPSPHHRSLKENKWLSLQKSNAVIESQSPAEPAVEMSHTPPTYQSGQVCALQTRSLWKRSCKGLAWGIWVDVSCACVFNNDWNWLLQEAKGEFWRTVICEYKDSFLQHPACAKHIGGANIMRARIRPHNVYSQKCVQWKKPEPHKGCFTGKGSWGKMYECFRQMQTEFSKGCDALRQLIKLITWITALSNLTKLTAVLCRATQYGRVLVESSDKTWSPREGNGKPLQYSCLKNPTNSMKRQKHRTLKDELPRLVGAQYATREEWR